MVALLLAMSACSADAGPDAGPDEAPVADPYELVAFDRVRINSHSEQPNFQEVSTTVDFGAGPFAKATLVIDLESPCFPFEKWLTNMPPQGQSWPADCDAFDRNWDFHLGAPAAGGGAPPIELVRAITPFGGPLHLEIDITDVANGLPGEHLLRSRIETWSDGAGKVSGSNGGWTVSARLQMVPGPAPREVLAVVSLANLVQNASGGPEPITFVVPKGTVSSRLEYRVTGHGGGPMDEACIGPSEEFCKRTHTLFVDGEELETFIPWRDDCELNCTVTTNEVEGLNRFDYCLENPGGAQGSVRAPRANWCPGTLTPPMSWSDVAALKEPGEHTFSWDIANVAQGGSWKVSATWFAFGS